MYLGVYVCMYMQPHSEHFLLSIISTGLSTISLMSKHAHMSQFIDNFNINSNILVKVIETIQIRPPYIYIFIPFTSLISA